MRRGRMPTAPSLGRVALVALAVSALLGAVTACSHDDKPAEMANRRTTTTVPVTASTVAPITAAVATTSAPTTTPAPPSTEPPPTTAPPTEAPSPPPTDPALDEAGREGTAPAGDDFGAPAGVSRVAQALGVDVSVYDVPGGTVTTTLSNPNENGAPLVFLVAEEGTGWLKVDLPVRPNGSTGWIRADQVSVVQHDYRIDVSVGRHQIAVMKGADSLLLEPVAIGTGDTPTPGGTFYLKELLQPPDPGGAYGPYAYGLSGFSNVLTDFAGGQGVIGIHGTNEPALLGTDVSHGCIRMSNDGITRLSSILPLGVPVRIMT